MFGSRARKKNLQRLYHRNGRRVIIQSVNFVANGWDAFVEEIQNLQQQLDESKARNPNVYVSSERAAELSSIETAIQRQRRGSTLGQHEIDLIDQNHDLQQIHDAFRQNEKNHAYPTDDDKKTRNDGMSADNSATKNDNSNVDDNDITDDKSLENKTLGRDPIALMHGREWCRLLQPSKLREKFSKDAYMRLVLGTENDQYDLPTEQPSADPNTSSSSSQYTQSDQLSEIHDAIMKDVTRTFPKAVIFNYPHNGKHLLFNVLSAYATYDPETGYCQGMAFLVGFLLLHVPHQEQVFWMFVKMMYEPAFNYRNLYARNCRVLRRCFDFLSKTIDRVAPELGKHLREQQFEPVIYATRWFLTAFSYHFRPEFVRIVWHQLFEHGIIVIFQTALAVLLYLQDTLLELSLEQLVPFMNQYLPLLDLPLDLARQAIHIPISPIEIRAVLSQSTSR